MNPLPSESASRRQFWTAVPLAFLLTLLILSPVSSERLPVELDEYAFISPVPGSKLVLPGNDIILRPGPVIDARSLSSGFIAVTGSQSGAHTGDLELCADGKTVLFKPHSPFALGEQVIVRLESGLSTSTGELISPGAFGFTVTPLAPGTTAPPTLEDCLGDLPPEESDITQSAVIPGNDSCDLPEGYPVFTVAYSSNPDPGHIFLAPFSPPLNAVGPLLVLDNLGQPIFYRQLELGALDFRKQDDGRLTYFDWLRRKHYALDQNYAVVDSFACGNGYSTDFHDLIVLPNGHALVFAYDPQPVRMDLLVPGGDPNATVIGLVIQEIDIDKNVIFQWRSWDHFDILDAEVSGAVDLTSDRIDYLHANAIEHTRDGNILISSRHLNEITKIDRQTGQIIWRLGAHAKNNEFKFPNDSRGFSHQHDVSEMHNGHISIHDNGNFVEPEYSRAVTYQVNEKSRLAPMVWEYRHSPDVFGGSMGNVQRRKSGGSMIGWGGTITGWKVTDLHEDGSLALELTSRGRLWTYRAVRHEWHTTLFTTTPEALHFGIVDSGDSATLLLSIQNNSPEELVIDCIQITNPSFTTDAYLPLTLSPGESQSIEVTFQPPDAREYTGKLYLRTSSTNEIIAQDVVLNGAGGIGAKVDFPDVQAVSLGLLPSHPNPARGSITLEYALAAPGPAQLAIYDIRGRKIRTLAEGVLAQGQHTTGWDHRDATGRRVSPGVYIVRFSAGAIRHEQKLVVTP